MEDINPLYLKKDIIDQIKNSYIESDPHIINLPNFLSINSYESLLNNLDRMTPAHKKIADRFSYSEHDIDINLLKDKAFLSWISEITRKKAKNVNYRCLRFGHKDYTLLHDSEAIGDRLEFFILIMKRWDTKWGGHTVYVAHDQQPILFPLEGNSFNLIQKTKNRHKFIQYINHHSGKENLYIIEGFIE